MKKAILIIIVLMFLTGCGIFDINDFTAPNDVKFIEMIENLNEPKKVSNYMIENFTYEVHHLYNLDPYALWKIKKGDCNDFAAFGIFIANYHGYITYQIRIYYKNTFIKHRIAIYKEDDKYNFSDNQYYYYVNYDNFSDIVELDSQWAHYLYGYVWLKYIVYDYDMNIVETGYNN